MHSSGPLSFVMTFVMARDPVMKPTVRVVVDTVLLVGQEMHYLLRNN